MDSLDEHGRDREGLTRLHLARALKRARGSLLWERLWPAIAAPLTAVGLFLALYWAGLWLVLPPLARAEVLMEAGAVWNSFLFAADGRTLWQLCARHAPETAAAITAATRIGESSLAAIYDTLPTVDFSAVVLGRSASDLSLLRVPSCGWTDLGTPPRVVECLRRIERRRAPHRAPWFQTVDLATVAREPVLAAVGA